MLDYETDILTIPAQVFNKVWRADRQAAADILDQADAAQAAFLENKYLKPEEGKGFVIGVKNALRSAYNNAVDFFHAEMPLRDSTAHSRYGTQPTSVVVMPRVMVASKFLNSALLDRIETDRLLTHAAGITDDEIKFLRSSPGAGYVFGKNFAHNL